MTEVTGTTSSSDAELIARVRDGDTDAFAELFGRHQEAAHRLARQLVRGEDTDDLVSEAFARVLLLLQNGSGPDEAFRAYLLTAVRRLHVDRIRAGRRLHVSDDLEAFDPGIPFQDTAVEGFERSTTAQAFASLPERWQLVLWHLDVEGQKPAQVAPLLGISANSVSALAYRAREGLRQAYLQMHLAATDDERCRWTNDRLGAYVRDGLSRRETYQVWDHLGHCRRCTAVYLELVEVNSNLRGLLAPLLLGGVAAGYLASTSGTASVGVLGLVNRVTDGVKNPGSAVATGAAGSVAAAAVAVALVVGSNGGAPSNPAADAARNAQSAPGPSDGGQQGGSPGSGPGSSGDGGSPSSGQGPGSGGGAGQPGGAQDSPPAAAGGDDDDAAPADAGPDAPAGAPAAGGPDAAPPDGPDDSR
ncbi:MAG: sigma-70 family RNA polymerase sigma factor, partial [Nocardioidaceae bacterium]